MARTSTPVRSAIAVAALVVALAGCGVKANSSYDHLNDRGPTGSTKDGRTTTTEGTGSGSGSGSGTGSIPGIDTGVFRQGLIDGFVQAGLSKDQASCMADAMIQAGLADTSTDPSNVDVTRAFDVMAQCNVSISDFTGGH